MTQSPSVVVLQHIACETLGRIQQSLSRSGLASRYVRVFDGEAVPAEIGGAGGLIVMGGPMSVYECDRLPHLRDEMRLIEQTLRAGLPVLGVCLGSQLLAQVLGSEVRAGAKKEIGWRRVRLTDAALADPLWRESPAEFMSFHWHGDVYDLPPGAVALASSEQTSCQGFRAGDSAYGILFHMEVDAALVEAMATRFADELAQEGGQLSSLLSDGERYLPALSTIGDRFFQGWARTVAK